MSNTFLHRSENSKHNLNFAKFNLNLRKHNLNLYKFNLNFEFRRRMIYLLSADDLSYVGGRFILRRHFTHFSSAIQATLNGGRNGLCQPFRFEKILGIWKQIFCNLLQCAKKLFIDIDFQYVLFSVSFFYIKFAENFRFLRIIINKYN